LAKESRQGMNRDEYCIILNNFVTPVFSPDDK